VSFFLKSRRVSLEKRPSGEGRAREELGLSSRREGTELVVM
jgi:hypothetical protein